LTWITMQNGSVLHVAAAADADAAYIAACYGGGPEAGAGSQLHIANQHG
jgi:hypothetical protein